MIVEMRDDSGNWVDVTSYAYSFKVYLQGVNSLDYAVVKLFKSVEDAVGSISKGKELRVKSDDYFFGGQIDLVSHDFGKLLLVKVFSYGQELLNKMVSEAYYDVSPESIVSDLIQKYTSLNFASSESSGFTISKIIFKDVTLGEAISTLAKLLGWGFRTDYAKNFYFEPKGASPSGLSLKVGDNLLGSPTWKQDSSRFCNHIILQGDKQEFQTEESFSGDGSTKEFVLKYTPQVVRVLVDGVEQKPIVSGATSGGSYSLDAESKKIIFETAPASGSSISVSYSYFVPIKIEVADRSSINRFGVEVVKKVVNKSIKTFNEARSYAKNYLSKFSKPILSTSVKVKGFDSRIVAGRTIHISDSLEGVDDDFVIVKAEYDSSTNQTTIKVGSDDLFVWNWQEEVAQRIKQLESSGGDTDIIQKYFFISNSLKASAKVSKIVVRTRPLGNMICLDRDYSEGVLDNPLLKLDYYSDDSSDGWAVYYSKTY